MFVYIPVEILTTNFTSNIPMIRDKFLQKRQSTQRLTELWGNLRNVNALAKEVLEERVTDYSLASAPEHIQMSKGSAE
ncbi:MAG: hypothetical protein PUP91_24540 [Rhizonema sp. PD37]|nr:hypothetical protein [Rhizonema sp. PD37]